MLTYNVCSLVFKLKAAVWKSVLQGPNQSFLKRPAVSSCQKMFQISHCIILYVNASWWTTVQWSQMCIAASARLSLYFSSLVVLLLSLERLIRLHSAHYCSGGGTTGSENSEEHEEEGVGLLRFRVLIGGKVNPNIFLLLISLSSLLSNEFYCFTGSLLSLHNIKMLICC